MSLDYDNWLIMQILLNLLSKQAREECEWCAKLSIWLTQQLTCATQAGNFIASIECNYIIIFLLEKCRPQPKFLHCYDAKQCWSWLFVLWSDGCNHYSNYLFYKNHCFASAFKSHKTKSTKLTVENKFLEFTFSWRAYAKCKYKWRKKRQLS